MKTVTQSIVVMNELILPNDTNFLGNLMGGKLMYWMDIAAAMSAMKHTNSLCVTASVDNLAFHKVIPLGSVVTIEACVTRVFNTSLEVLIKAWSENFVTQKKEITHEAFFTFVAIDNNTRIPIKAPPILPETDDQKTLYESAFQRKQMRLFWAGKLKMDANQVAQLFQQTEH